MTRETVRSVKEKLKQDSEDENSSFYKHKMKKLKPPDLTGINDRRGKTGRQEQYKNHIGTDDIANYLGSPWDKSYQMVLINQAMNELNEIPV